MHTIRKILTISLGELGAYVRCFLLMIFYTAAAYLVICAVSIGALINQMDAALTEAADLVNVVQYVTTNRVLVFAAFLYGLTAMFIKNMGYYSRYNPKAVNFATGGHVPRTLSKEEIDRLKT